ncbi:MAG: hypothetical protein ABIB98_03950 [bacterium]
MKGLLIFVVVVILTSLILSSCTGGTDYWVYMGKDGSELSMPAIVIEKHWDGGYLASSFRLFVQRTDNGENGVVVIGGQTYSHIEEGEKIYIKP